MSKAKNVTPVFAAGSLAFAVATLSLTAPDARGDAFEDGLAGAVGGAIIGGLVDGRRGAAKGAMFGGAVGVVSGAEREYRCERDLRDQEREIIVDEIEDEYYRQEIEAEIIEADLYA